MQAPFVGDDYILISKNDMARLTQAINSVKEFLPHVVNADLVAAYRSQQILEEGCIRQFLMNTKLNQNCWRCFVCY